MKPDQPTEPKETIDTREGYDRWASIYDDEDNPLVMLEDEHFPSLLGSIKGQRVLDVGCGTGRQTVRLVERGAVVTALDFSEGMLERARQRRQLADVTFVVHNANHPLPFEAASFDCVVSCLVLEHVDDVDAFIDQLARVCKPTGRILLSAMHPAMMLLGVSARFSDPETGRRLYPRSHAHQISDVVMAAKRSGLQIAHMSEHAFDDALAERSPRSQRYLGYPMLLLVALERSGRQG